MLAPLALVLATLAGDPAPIHWKEKRLALDALPSELPPAARAALQAWHPWCSDHAYRLDLEASGKVLVLSRASNDRIDQELELVEAVLARFAVELPPPAARLPVPEPGAEAPPPAPVAKDTPLPEDPEDPDGGDHPWKLTSTKPAERTSAAPKTTTWGAQGVEPDTQTVVLCLVRDQDDFVLLLRHLAETYPYLAAWTEAARANQGFVLGEPCIGAYLERPDGVEEWNADNELVHRVARLLALDRYGELPNWFLLGYAWQQELALLKGVYCFPWRDEFVWATEHGGWPAAVKSRYSRARLAPADFMNFRRGKYVDEMAKASWAMTAWLVTRERARLPALLEELRVLREVQARVPDGPGRWRKDPDHEVPLAEQVKLFQKHLGADYLARATAFVRDGLGD